MALIPVSALPKTRLELRWRDIERDADGYDCFCDYDLVLELDALDIRGEVHDDEGNLLRREREKRLSLGGTRTTRSDYLVNHKHGEIRTPFRDHSHILWDSLKLKLPAYVVAGEWAMDVVQHRQALAISRGEVWP
jgi:hypothetical protein